jgi:hypothetical protein
LVNGRIWCFLIACFIPHFVSIEDNMLHGVSVSSNYDRKFPNTKLKSLI